MPGNLLLSLVPRFVQQHLELVSPLVGMSVGYDKVRFKASTHTNDPLHFYAEISHVRVHKNGVYVTYNVACERDGDMVMALEMRDYYALRIGS